MSQKGYIEVDGQGRIACSDRRILKHLAGRAGKWRPVPTPDELLIFKRIGPGDQDISQDSVERRIGRVVFSGVIERSGDLVDVLTFVYSNKKSGVLVVLNEETKKTIFFQNGDLRMATSNLPEDRIGAVLYRYGLVTNAQLESAQRKVNGKRKFGQVLVDEGALTVHDLYKTIRKQIEDIFYSVLLFREGEFYFYTMKKEGSLPVLMSLSTNNLLMEGVRRIDEMSYFREKLPSGEVILEVAPEVPPKRLEEKESKVYFLIDGKRTVRDIGRESRLGEFETTKIIFHLLQMRYIRILEQAEMVRGLKPVDVVEALHQVVETFNQVYRKIFAAVRNKGGEEELRSGLDSFFGGSTGYGDLFKNIELQRDGSLPVKPLLESLEKLQTQNKSDFLYQALNELLFFEMFTAGQTLSDEDEKVLRERLNEIFVKMKR